MKKLFREIFTYTLILFVACGILTVVLQTLSIITMQSALSIWVYNGIRKVAIGASGVCGLAAFGYLLFSREKAKTDDDD